MFLEDRKPENTIPELDSCGVVEWDIERWDERYEGYYTAKAR